MVGSYTAGYDLDIEETAARLRALGDAIDADEVALTNLNSEAHVRFDDTVNAYLGVEFHSEDARLIDPVAYQGDGDRWAAEAEEAAEQEEGVEGPVTEVPCGCGDYCFRVEADGIDAVEELTVRCPECGNRFGFGTTARSRRHPDDGPGEDCECDCGDWRMCTCCYPDDEGDATIEVSDSLDSEHDGSETTIRADFSDAVRRLIHGATREGGEEEGDECVACGDEPVDHPGREFHDVPAAEGVSVCEWCAKNPPIRGGGS